MKKAAKLRLYSALRLGFAFFSNIGSAFFFAIPFSGSIGELILNIVFCIVYLYIALAINNFLQNERGN